MNAWIFKIFGVAILVFELLLVLAFSMGMPRLATNDRDLAEGLPFFFGFLLLATLIAIGLIRLHRWAAVTASTLGLIWAFILASTLGNAPWQSCIVGMPVVFGMLLPLYETIRNWSRLQTVGDLNLKSFSDSLRSSDRFRLE